MCEGGLGPSCMGPGALCFTQQRKEPGGNLPVNVVWFVLLLVL